MGQCIRDEDNGCRRCEAPLGFDFTMAYQPIMDLARGEPFGYEALVRGLEGQSAHTILSQVARPSVYSFDQACRQRALEIAGRLGCERLVSINFLPNAVYEPYACIQTTLELAEQMAWPHRQIMFEVMESECVRDRGHLQNIFEAYRTMGFLTAIDDFGAGYANLDLLVDLRPDIVKIDRQLIIDIDHSPRRQAIVDALVAMAERLAFRLVAEGVETLAEAAWLYGRGITVQQGFFHARPAIEQLPAYDDRRIAAIRDAAARAA
jgi:EAL domain-containing protein (putative c-di-GMP-specific phosphodiesterase class I)